MAQRFLGLVLASLSLSPPGAEVVPAGGAVPTLVLVDPGEPGEPMVIDGRVTDAAGSPLSAVVVEAVQTGADGYYRRGPGGLELGSGLARLKGKVTTDAGGRFRLRTIRPGSYPGRAVAAHIHFEIGHPSFAREELTLYFEGDAHLPTGSTDRAYDDPRTYVRPAERDGDRVWRISVELRPPASRK